MTKTIHCAVCGWSGVYSHTEWLHHLTRRCIQVKGMYS